MRRRFQAWQWLIITFASFWILFAIVMIVSNFPFFVISIALTTIGALSALIVALAWAFQNNV
ncbi:MAG: hypothetical protein NVSMB38_32390 [Ktedonobacteraceae bacterium]